MSRQKVAEIGITSTLVGDRIEYDLTSAHKQQNSRPPRLIFKKPKWTMVFRIQPNALDLRFKPSPRDAFWVSADRCPQTASHDYSQLNPICVSGDGQVLTVENVNGCEKQFHFALNFEDGKSHNPRSFDPIVDNKNGADLLPGDFVASLVIGIGGVAAAAFGLKVALNRAKDRRR